MQLECPSRFRWLEKQSVRESFAQDVALGLSQHPRRLPCRYFYDAQGSQLFEEICSLPEYYLTRAEHQILERYAAQIVGQAPAGLSMVELGSGSASKTRLLFSAYLQFHSRLCYVPIDISPSMLEESSQQLLADYAGLEILGVAAEYEPGLTALRRLPKGPKMILWLGSNVGNLHRTEASGFLTKVVSAMEETDFLLLGVDLRKDSQVLLRAYDDAQGVTARFNLNLLARINRELDANFQLDAFRHQVNYDEEAGRVEMYLSSQRVQKVQLRRLGLEIDWQAGERLHTENSYKYSPAELDRLVHSTGLRFLGRWSDDQGRFALTLLTRS
ncbi:L-histidine N(alpha)-methyltransferase [bacterium]|nr:L-histidine N(alpha)-methyltransferase [bacterium]